MPCRNDYPEDNVVVRSEERLHNGVNAARLCGILTTLEAEGKLNSILKRVDWKEAGTSLQDLESWWAEHKAIDAKRRKKEAAEALRRKKAEAERQTALDLQKKPWAEMTARERRIFAKYTK
jgi:hypothetical protein